MKKLIALTLVLALTTVFAAGCKKKEEAPKPAPAVEAPKPVMAPMTGKSAAAAPAAAPAAGAPAAPAAAPVAPAAPAAPAKK